MFEEHKTSHYWKVSLVLAPSLFYSYKPATHTHTNFHHHHYTTTSTFTINTNTNNSNNNNVRQRQVVITRPCMCIAEYPVLLRGKRNAASVTGRQQQRVCRFWTVCLRQQTGRPAAVKVNFRTLAKTATTKLLLCQQFSCAWRVRQTLTSGKLATSGSLKAALKKKQRRKGK